MTERGGGGLDDAGYSASADGRQGPFEEWSHVGQSGRGDDRSRDNGRGGGKGIEKVVHPRDVIGRDLENGCGGERHDRGRRRNPLEAAAELQVPSVGRDAHDEEGHEHPKTARRGEAQAHEEAGERPHREFHPYIIS